MDGAKIGTRRLYDPGHPQAEIRAVDGDQRLGPRRQHRCGCLSDPPLQGQVFRQYLGNTHDRKLFHRKQAFQPLGLHQRAAHPVKGDTRHQCLQPHHKRSTQPIPGRLTRDQEQRHARVPVPGLTRDLGPRRRLQRRLRPRRRAGAGWTHTLIPAPKGTTPTLRPAASSRPDQGRSPRPPETQAPPAPQPPRRARFQAPASAGRSAGPAPALAP